MLKELSHNQRCSRFPRSCNNLRRKLGASLRPKIKTRKFALEVAWFSTKKEGASAEIGGEGAHGGFFRQSRTHLSKRSPQESENRCGVFLLGIATVAVAYSNEEAGVEASMNLAP